MRVGIITNISSPYKTLQINEFCNIENTQINVYYTEPKNKTIKWEEKKPKFKEVGLEQYKILSKYNFILNKGITNIIKNNDLILLSGYDQLSMIFASLLCRIYKKKYVVLFDGISTNRVHQKENIIKKIVKKIVIDGSYSIMANGTVGRLYFENIFNYPSHKIYNQYLSVDYEQIRRLALNKYEYRKKYRDKYGIKNDQNVVLYSGRLIEKKNVESLIYAISSLKNKDIVLLITGGGKLEKYLKSLAEKLNVNIIVTGFISKQEELFKHYFAGDVLVLPSLEEPWGLVVNECMAAELPVIVSSVCGCSMDLVIESENGYLINPNDIYDIKVKISKVLYEDNFSKMGKKSLEIIQKWNFENSKSSLNKIIEGIRYNG